MLTAALVAPYFINWTSYRADFEREASAILGRKVTVEGDAQAWLLPFPSVSFSNVTVGAGTSGEPAMTIETFSMDSELAPFLHGEFLIFDMRIVGPRAIVDIAQDGTIDWAMRPSSPFAIGQVSVEKLTITDGQIEVRHRISGRTHMLTEINAEMSAKSLAGPWRLDGALKFDGEQTSLSASTGAVDPKGRMRLRIKAKPDLHPVSLDADGEVMRENTGLAYSGTFRVIEAALQGSSDKADRVQTTDAKQQDEPLFRVNGRFKLDTGKLDVSEFRFETGPADAPYNADGVASLDFGADPRFAIKASGAQMRFDEAVGISEGSQLTLEERIEAFEHALINLPKPEIPGSIEVDLPAIVTGDTTIRDVRLAAEPAEGGWTLKAAHATLPGRTTLEANGFLRIEGDFGFTGSLLVAIAQPSGFAAWVAKDIDDAIRRLPSAGFSAKVEISQDEQFFSDLELVLGDARFHGELESRQPQDQRPSVLLKLDGGALDVDGLTAFASLFVNDAGENRFDQSDLDFQVKAGPVSGAGLSADTIDTTLRLREGRLEIDRLSIDGLAGTSISATGSIKDFPNSPTGNIDASLVSVDLAPLVMALSDSFPDNPLAHQLRLRVAEHPELLTDARLDVVGNAGMNGDGATAVSLSLQGGAGGSALSASVSADGLSDALRHAKMKLVLSARNEDSTALLALAGLHTTPTPLSSLGSGELSLSAEGVASEGMVSVLELKGDQFLASFNGTTVFGDDGFTAKGQAHIDAADIEPWLTTVGMALPGMGLGSTVEFSAEIDLGSGLLVLNSIDGVVNETAVAGDLNITFADGSPNLNGALMLDALSLDPFAAMVVGENALASERGWPTEPFSQNPVLPLSGSVDVSAATLTVGVLSLQDATMSLGLDKEGLRVNDLSAGYVGGKLSGRFELKNTDGTALISGQMQLTNFDLGSEDDGSRGIRGKGTVSASLAGNGKSIEALVASLSGSGTAAFKGVAIEGVNGDALPALLARADALGRDIDVAKVAAFAPKIASEGSFAGGDAEVAFTIAGGILRAPPVTLRSATALVSADLRADLNTGDLLADGTVAYAAGENALTGSEPVLRFAAAGRAGDARITFDSEPLAQFLTQRALEREQARVEAMQAVLLEKQRLRREVRYYAGLQAEREQAAVEALRKAEQEARQRAEDEARARAQEEERKRRAEEEAKRRAEAEQRAATEAKRARLDAEVRERVKAEAKKKAQAEQEAKKRAQAERRAAEKARQRADEQARAKAEEEEFERLKAEEEARQAKARGSSTNNGGTPARPAAPSAIGTFIKSLTGG